MNLARAVAREDGERGLRQAREAAEHSLRIAPPTIRKYPLDTMATIQWESGEHAAAIATLVRLTLEFPWEDRYRSELESLRARCP